MLACRANTNGVSTYLNEHLVLSFNASHLVKPAQLYHYTTVCPVPRLTTDFARRPFSYAAPVIWNSLPTEVICCAIRNIVLKDILRHSCLIAVTKPSDRYHTSGSAAVCRHTWRFINVLVIIIIKRLFKQVCLQAFLERRQ